MKASCSPENPKLQSKHKVFDTMLPIKTVAADAPPAYADAVVNPLAQPYGGGKEFNIPSLLYPRILPQKPLHGHCVYYGQSKAKFSAQPPHSKRMGVVVIVFAFPRKTTGRGYSGRATSLKSGATTPSPNQSGNDTSARLSDGTSGLDHPSSSTLFPQVVSMVC